MPSYRKPIHRSVWLGCAVYISLICILASGLGHLMLSRVATANYRARLGDLLEYVESVADADDLHMCIETGQPSERYAELQDFLNGLVDRFELRYLYIVIPQEGDRTALVNVCSATSEAERAAGEEDLPLLYVSYAYPREEIRRYLSAWDKQETSYFVEYSDYGKFYTACRPLRASNGETVALACCDISMQDLRQSVSAYTIYTVLLTILIGVVCGTMQILWMRRNVTDPLRALERSARSFAEKSHNREDSGSLVFEAPDINTQNEVESLADAITQMSVDMKAYIDDVVAAEKRVREAEKVVEGMTKIAYQDALTHVKSKAAYDTAVAVLERNIAAGNAEFAIVMIDLNNLKFVNDTYGHENGNQYLIDSSGIISDAWQHSPVFRIGGDEFVVLLQGRDYTNREELFTQMNKTFWKLQEDETLQPWERCSAASGMAVYDPEDDVCVDEVFRRADEDMYENKKRLKANAKRGNIHER